MEKKEIIQISPLKIELDIKDNLILHIYLSLIPSPCKTRHRIYSETGKLALKFFMHYFEKKDNPSLSLPLAWDTVTPFQKQVFTCLIKHTKFGSHISYKKLAQLIGNIKAQRAVGRALNKNPWPIVIPCHRVIKQDKKIGGFSSGIEIKKILLKHEEIKYIGG